MTTTKEPRIRTKNGAPLAWLKALCEGEDLDGCVDWPFGTMKGTADDLYGVVGLNGRSVKANHAALLLSGAERPPGAVAMHSCDRPICVAPWHQAWGSPRENVADRQAKGRSRNAGRKITDDDVREIRAAVGKQTEIGKRYGITGAYVSMIKSRKVYAEVV